jgi:nucleotide-binding universal stress UspA family protein
VKVIPGRSITEGILTIADSLKADIIVMGSHSRTGLARVILGSVAESVLRRAKVPVLIVPVAALEASQRQAVVSSQAI